MSFLPSKNKFERVDDEIHIMGPAWSSLGFANHELVFDTCAMLILVAMKKLLKHNRV